jgi:hypothetical protein
MKFPQRIARWSITAILCGAWLAGAASAQAENVTMHLQDLGHGAYALEGHMAVDATPYEAWKVLTDYENISRFVSSLRKSAIKDSTPDRLLLEQEALGKALFITRRIRVLLQVSEMPYHTVNFEDVAHKDFEYYKGSWEIRGTAGGLDVVYTLNCKRRFVVPNFVARDALKKSAEGLLAEVRAEILRRKQEACCHENKKVN